MFVPSRRSMNRTICYRLILSWKLAIIQNIEGTMTELTTPTKYLSKYSYMAGLDCHRKLWQLLWDRESAAPDSGMSRLIMEYGNRFGQLAHSLFPDGILIDIDIFNLNKSVEDTRKAIKSGADVIMEAAFCHGQCRIMADMVEKQPNGSWHLFEVK
jgi:hypothetical protein